MIDKNNILILIGKSLCTVKANLTCSDNDYLHRFSLYSFSFVN